MNEYERNREEQLETALLQQDVTSIKKTLEKLVKSVEDYNTRIAVLEFKAGLWGVLGGAIVATGMLLFELLKRG